MAQTHPFSFLYKHVTGFVVFGVERVVVMSGDSERERERERDYYNYYSTQNYYNRDYNNRHVAIGPRRGAFVSPCACVCLRERERERERERCNVKSDVRSFSCFVFTGAKGGPRELTPQLTCKNTKLRALIYRHKNFCDGPTNHPNSTAPLPRSLSW